ncbi:MAG: VTC domain-containing protein [Deltaproteobacteria bacterium]|nr:VTC domain-containing protein [Deltaproteobacteria bacterium]
MAAIACVTARLVPGPEVERKFVATREVVRDFLSSVARWVSPVVYDRARPVAYTRTTYLDSDAMDYLRSDTGRDSVRVRLRVREYAAAFGPLDVPVLTGRCFLELKESVGTVRRKVRFSAPPRAIGRLVATSARAGHLPDGLPPIIANRLRRDRPAPRVATWYRRASFVDAPSRARITVDDSIQICKPSWPGSAGVPPAPRDALATLGCVIVELKHSGDPPEWLARAAAALGRATELSKFVLAMGALG